MEVIEDLDASVPFREPINKNFHIDLGLFSCLQTLESALALLSRFVTLIHTCDIVR